MSEKVTHLPRAKKSWKSSYLPRVEREAAGHAIRRLCRHASNDNKATLLKAIKVTMIRYQSAFTISFLTIATIIITAAQALS